MSVPSFQTLASISSRFGSQTSSVVKLGAFFPYFDICKSMVTLLNVSTLHSCVEKWNKRVYHNQDTNYVLCFFSPSVALELRCMSNLWWLCGILEGEEGRGGVVEGEHWPSSRPAHQLSILDVNHAVAGLIRDGTLIAFWHPSSMDSVLHTSSKLNTPKVWGVCVCVLLCLFLLKDFDSKCSDCVSVCFTLWGWYYRVRLWFSENCKKF